MLPGTSPASYRGHSPFLRAEEEPSLLKYISCSLSPQFYTEWGLTRKGEEWLWKRQPSWSIYASGTVCVGGFQGPRPLLSIELHTFVHQKGRRDGLVVRAQRALAEDAGRSPALLSDDCSSLACSSSLIATTPHSHEHPHTQRSVIGLERWLSC